ncbi:CGNR zinc finger domain-containing protein [Nocardia sp. NPDC058058]|uniref:CGNR zinc finger domain-containing protein n=1 Tax=Nocardia sp. NPDC058058 TaxID=3346317 RepID=UPI0036D8A343
MDVVRIDHYKWWGIGLALALANSDPEIAGTETLDSPAAVDRLLRAHGATGIQISDDDLPHLRRIRPHLLRAVRDPSPDRAAPLLNHVAAEAGATPRLTNHDGLPWHIDFHTPASTAWRHIAAEAAAALMGFLIARGPDRIRLCSARDCHRYYADTTKNNSMRYCPDRGCANRERVRRHRQRNG